MSPSNMCDTPRPSNACRTPASKKSKRRRVIENSDLNDHELIIALGNDNEFFKIMLKVK